MNKVRTLDLVQLEPENVNLRILYGDLEMVRYYFLAEMPELNNEYPWSEHA
jgi:hypothetical protein